MTLLAEYRGLGRVVICPSWCHVHMAVGPVTLCLQQQILGPQQHFGRGCQLTRLEIAVLLKIRKRFLIRGLCFGQETWLRSQTAAQRCPGIGFRQQFMGGANLPPGRFGWRQGVLTVQGQWKKQNCGKSHGWPAWSCFKENVNRNSAGEPSGR